MSVSDAQRRALHADCERALSPQSADVIMELLPPVGWSDVARQSQILALESKIDAQFVAVRAEMTKLEAKIDSQVPRLIALNTIAVLSTAFATAGLVFGAVRLG